MYRQSYLFEALGINDLDRAVAEERLSKIEVYRPPQSCRFKSEAENVHFYCQRGMERDLPQVAEFHRAMWEGRESAATLSKDLGLYFGYTQEDIAVFQKGGYAALPVVPRLFMEFTHDLRKATRLESILNLEPP